MTPILLATVLLSGLLAGFIHVVSGPDHLAAIAPYAVDAKARAWRTGVRWGVGHSAGVAGVGLLALLLRDALSIDLVSAWGERCVGLMLCAIGMWGLKAAFADRSVAGEHCHRGQSHGARNRHPAFAVGTVHGLAGSSHMLGVVPALALPTDADTVAYLLLFGLGTTAAMAGFSSFVGWLAGHPFMRNVKVQKLLMGSASTVAIAVGVFWVCQGV